MSSSEHILHWLCVSAQLLTQRTPERNLGTSEKIFAKAVSPQRMVHVTLSTSKEMKMVKTFWQLHWPTLIFTESLQNKITLQCFWPFAVVCARLSDLLQEVGRVGEGSAVTDVVNHHKTVCPVHGLQYTPGLRALPRTTHAFIFISAWVDYTHSPSYMAWMDSNAEKLST